MLNFPVQNRSETEEQRETAPPRREPSEMARPPVVPADRLSLRFTGPYAHLEDAYQKQYFIHHLTHIRNCHWLAIFFYSVFGLLDYYLFPESAESFLIIRFGIVCPLFLVGLVLSYMSWYHRIWTWMMMFFVLLTATGYTIMGNMAPMMHSFGYFVGVVACLIFGYTFIRLPFLHASGAGWLVFFIYCLLGEGITGRPESVTVNQFAYLAGFNLLLMIVCYTRERADRHNFFLASLLAAEKEKVSQINEGLEETVKTRTRDLELANAQLSREIEAHIASEEAKEQLAKQLRQAQKMEAMGTLAGGIAHDFNNILGSIMGFTELSLDDAEPGTIQYSNLEEVLVAGKRARDLIKQILAFSRRGEQSMQPVALEEIMGEVQKLLRATLPSYIAVEVDVRSKANIFGDPSQINQVLMNLGINAAQAMEPDGGSLHIVLDKTILHQGFCDRHPGTSPGAHACLSIVDNGSGIPMEILERVFDPFFTTKPQGQGTGLGLSVVHGIVKNHGGAITVQSEMGKGTKFTIYLPILAKATSKETPLIPEIQGGHERILCIDDEQALVNYSRQTLTLLGYIVTTRNDPLEALELFKATHDQFDLVITDLTMPHLSGDSLAKNLKKIRPDIPVILASGLDTRISPQRIEEVGISAVINKPILRSELASTVRRVLDLTKVGAACSSG